MESLLRQATERSLETLRFKDSPKKTTAIDEELEELVTRQKAKIKVFGIGGGGNNTINRKQSRSTPTPKIYSTPPQTQKSLLEKNSPTASAQEASQKSEKTLQKKAKKT